MEQENKMGTMPMRPLLLGISVPIMISMLVQAMYNIVDSIFVARLGEDALTAVSLVFPIQNLMVAVGVGTSVGMGSLLSRRLGERNQQAADKVAANGLLLAGFSWLAFVVVGLVFTGPFFASYAAEPSMAAIAKMGSTYMCIVTIASPGLFFAITFERLVQSTGRSVYSMISQLAGAITNIILDPIMIFGLFGFPRMEVAGAALATVIGQFVGMFVGMFFNFARNKDIRFHKEYFRPEWRTIKGIYSVGLPSILMQSIGSVMVFVMNKILINFGTTPVSVLGIYFKLQSFIFMPVFGLNSGMVPIVAYNYGARRPERIRECVRLALILCLGIMIFGMLLFWLLPGPLLMMFDAQPAMLEVGTAALRTISIGFPIAAVCIAFSGVFQALGQGIYSLVMSVVRQLVFLLPLAWLFSTLSGLPLLWFAFPIAEVFALILAVVLFRRSWRQKIKPLELEEKQAQKTNASE